MSIFDDIGKALGGIISGGVGGVVDKVGDIFKILKGDKEDDPKLSAAELQLKLELTKLQNDLQTKMSDAVTGDLANQRELIKAELSNEDPYVRRARPTIIWVGIIIFLFNYALLPFITTMVQLFGGGFSFVPITLPTEFWGVWGIYTGGYAYLRTREKQGGNIKLPLGK